MRFRGCKTLFASCHGDEIALITQENIFFNCIGECSLLLFGGCMIGGAKVCELCGYFCENGNSTRSGHIFEHSRM